MTLGELVLCCLVLGLCCFKNMAIQAQSYAENLGFNFNGAQDLMDNAYELNELCFNLPQQKQQYIQHQRVQNLQQRNQNLCFDNSVLLPKTNTNNHHSMPFSQTIASQIERQKQEIDQFITIENERLRLALVEQRKQQLGSVLKYYESKTHILLRQKDEEICKVVKRSMELEESLRRMEIENQTWERVARENEAMVTSLNTTIEEMKESACFLTNGFGVEVEDAESCCDSDRMEKRGGHVEDEERRRQMTCKSCNSGTSCYVFLPCRHLCSCKACEAFLEFCPVCTMVKKARIEVLI